MIFQTEVSKSHMLLLVYQKRKTQELGVFLLDGMCSAQGTTRKTLFTLQCHLIALH